MQWRSIISKQNLKLAWQRINTGSNLQYKRFFRESYLVYESASVDHLRELRRALVNNVWEPSYATRLYLPKPSGLQRPLSLLAIQDQIVLQAIANQFARKLRQKRQKVELKSVFSNKLTDEANSIFFTERWQLTYRKFQEKCTDIFNEGYRWVADFDLAAYYDTISHALLLTTVSPRSSDQKAKKSLEKWLGVWSANELSTVTGHGIPQGPIASDFLAESFFLPIDLRLQRENFRYVRYVDDIRIFCKSENEARKAIVLIEQECRHRGLIPQSAKIQVRELRTAEDAIGTLPSIPPTDGSHSSQPALSRMTARSILDTSIEGKPLKVTDKSRFRYAMYRAPEDPKILDRALLLLPRHPEHIDAFVAYFRNYANRPRIARAALEYLAGDTPYSYVRGELWHIVARLAKIPELIDGIPIALIDAQNRKNCVALSWGVMHFLIRCDEEHLRQFKRSRLKSENSISRSLLAPILGNCEFTKTGHARTLLKGTLMEQLAGARELQRRNVSLKAIGLQQQDLAPDCRIALLSLGVVPRLHRRTQPDWIAKILVNLYSCKNKAIWRGLLASEYEHALQILVETKARFLGAFSDWLSLQDSFNDILVRKLFEFLKAKKLSGHAKVVGKNGKIVKYGVLIAPNAPFDRIYPNISSRLRTLHNRRNTIPGSHPYDEKGGSRNRWLSRRERDTLTASLRIALDDISQLIERNS